MLGCENATVFAAHFRGRIAVDYARHNMRVSRVVWIVSACVAAIVAGEALSVWLLWPRIAMWGVGIHQKNVTRELAEWGQEYSAISDDASAIRAAEMVGYMSHYYVPGPGYRGPADMEAALETQRRKSIDRVVASLEQYTGLRLGAKPQRWTEWAQEQKDRPGVQSGGEPASRANDRQPIRSR
jgi:hypothetical protein